MRSIDISKLKEYRRIIYEMYIKPKSLDEDFARREFIFTVLVLSSIFLIATAFIISFVRFIIGTDSGQNTSPSTISLPLIIMVGLYAQSRKKYNNKLSYVLIAIYLLLGTYALYRYGYVMPQGLLIYVLVIVLAGILISSTASAIMIGTVIISLTILAIYQRANISQPYVEELIHPLKKNDLIVYIAIFVVIFLVSWLSNREIERSLKRARTSEKLLRKERNMLETKVRKRTRELESAQVEKTMELYKFAEFGRLSSSLLHDLANPLTAVSLNFSEIETSQKSELASQVRHGISHMEQYVESARRQLRSHKESQLFSSKNEIEKVCQLLKPKATLRKTTIKSDLTPRAMLYGDNTKFNQIVSNLIANAIDAYDGSEMHKKRNVIIKSTIEHQTSMLRITISDKGIGIPLTKLERVFDPFYTTKSSDRGTGIGLTIARRIIQEDFNGSITAQSSKDNGTVFTLKLPLADHKTVISS